MKNKILFSFHPVFCWDVERKGDMYYLEAGSAMTCFSLSDLSNLFRTDERAIAAGPIMASLQHRYQVCNGKKMLAALKETPSPNANVPDSSNKKRHISDLIDIPHMAEFINDQEIDCLVLLCAKDKINTGLWPLFRFLIDIPLWMKGRAGEKILQPMNLSWGH